MTNPVRRANSSQIHARLFGLFLVVTLTGLLACSERGSSSPSKDEPDQDVLEVVPLATPASAATSTTLFEKLPPARTGVAFQNRIDITHPLKRLYHSGFVCGGCAIGDVDGNGRPDLFFASGPGPNQLYLQTGPLTFAVCRSEEIVCG